MRRHLKRWFLLAVYHSGVWRLVRRANGRRLAILMYHGVTERDHGLWTQVPRAAFERQMAYLARHHRPVALSEAVAGLGRTHGVDRTVAVTFDDGFANNATVALEVLRRHGVPATVYLATGFVDGGRGSMIWTDRVYALLRAARERGADLSPLGIDPGERSPAELKEALCRRLKRVPDAEKNDFLARLESLAGPPLEEDVELFAPLDWEQVGHMARRGRVDFGAHTVEHVILTSVDRERAAEEIGHSQLRVSERVGEPVRHFAYPNGTPEDFDEDIRGLVAESFETAVTTVEGLNDPGDDVYTLKRVAVGSDLSFEEFVLQVSGTMYLLRRLPGLGHV